MPTALRAALRRHPALLLAFVLAAGFTALFVIRLVAGVIYWEANENAPVRPWMTAHYVARSWDVAPEALEAAAGIARRRTLAQEAAAEGVSVEEVIARVEAAVAALKAQP